MTDTRLEEIAREYNMHWWKNDWPKPNAALLALLEQARREGEQSSENTITALHAMLQGAFALLPPEDSERLGITKALDCERLDCKLFNGLIEKARREGADEMEEQLLGCDPCPKCGHGIVSSCYGCKLDAAEAQNLKNVRAYSEELEKRTAALHEAESRVKELEAERDQLKANLTTWQAAANINANAVKAHKADLAALRQENERLKAQIDRLAQFFLTEHPQWVGEGGAVDNAIYRLQLLDAENERLTKLNACQDCKEYRAKAEAEIRRLRAALDRTRP